MPAVMTAILFVVLPVEGATQGIDSREESRLLREASAMEWRGRIDEAERILLRLLGAHPTSSGGLFALERILRNQERVAEVLPWADRYLEADSQASGVRYMKLRVLVEVDSLSALDQEAEAWFQAEPGSPDPYREVARLYQRALGDARALALLREGRDRLGRPDALAMEMGDLLAAMGQEAAAVEEWSRAVASPQVDLPATLRRLDGLEGDPATLAPPLLEALTREPTSLERRAAAVRVALQLGLVEEALGLAAESADVVDGSERQAFLGDVARRADEAGLPSVALWALQEERRMAGVREVASLDVRIAATALQAGDTATAVEAQSRLARSLPAGSVERREVMADLLRVEAASASRETLTTRLGAFAEEYPGAAELDELRARVAAGLAGRGQVEAAGQVLDDAEGPLSATERGYLHLGEGAVEDGTEALEGALPALAPARATEVLHLLSYLERISDPAAEALARAAAQAHHGNPADGVAALVEAIPEVPDADRAPLLAWAGEQATAAGAVAQAEDFYATLVEAYPDAREFPDAALALARIRLDRGDRIAAREILERLILERPSSPVVPAARRELQRIRPGDPATLRRTP